MLGAFVFFPFLLSIGFGLASASIVTTCGIDETFVGVVWGVLLPLGGIGNTLVMV